MKKKNRLSIFIDGNNFRHGLKAFIRNEQIDWKTFLEEIQRDYDVVQAMYYIGKITHPLFDKDKVKEQDRMLKELKKSGYIPWLGYFNDDKSEKGVDVQIALDIAVGAIKGKFDVALIISGDGDLSNAIKIAQQHDVKAILGFIAGTKGSTYRISWVLKEISDSQTALNKQVEKAYKVWQKKNPHPKKKKESNKKAPEEILVFSDGGARGNPGHAGCGAAITDKKGTVLKKVSHYIGKSTNNQAEYMALLFGLAAAEEMGAKKITCYTDSQLVVKQVTNQWKVKHATLKEYHQQVQLFIKEHPNTSFHHIPREKNTLADQLANLAMDRKK